MTTISTPKSLKLLMITAVREDEKIIKEAFKQVDVPVYSSFEIEGHQAKPEGKAITSWFAMPQPNMDASVYFAFIPAEMAEQVVEIIKKANVEHAAHPIRSFMLDAMQFS